MRNPFMLLALLATSGVVLLAAALERRRRASDDRHRNGGDASFSGDTVPERRRGDRPEPPAPARSPQLDNLEPFARPDSGDERR
jgi:hypothetical protein